MSIDQLINDQLINDQRKYEQNDTNMRYLDNTKPYLKCCICIHTICWSRKMDLFMVLL